MLGDSTSSLVSCRVVVSTEVNGTVAGDAIGNRSSLDVVERDSYVRDDASSGVYTSGWGWYTGLGGNNGDGKMTIIQGPVFDVEGNATHSRRQARHTRHDLALAGMAVWRCLADRLMLAVRVSLQLRSPAGGRH